MTLLKGSESGKYLAPGGVNFYKSLLKDSYLLESEEHEPDSSINTFAISYKEEFFEFKPSINVILDQKSLREIKKEIFLTIIAKENISRQCEIIYEEIINFRENKPLELVLKEKHFEKFTFNNSIYLDAIVYSKEKGKFPTIESIKRFTLRFTGILGLFTPEPRPPEFFEIHGGGKNSMSLTIIEAEDKDQFTDLNASEILKVYINENCVREFDSMLNQNVATSNALSIYWVSNIVNQAVLKLFEICDKYPIPKNPESIASRIFKFLKINNEDEYKHMRFLIQSNPESINIKIQNELKLSEIIQDFRGKKK
tara:strand:+ start:2279 stop:3211 length:933 start_codon:yes stop_codon:yes gene_type:complete